MPEVLKADVKVGLENFLNSPRFALSEFACKNSDVVRFRDADEDIRPPFFRDADKVLHSFCYSRYIDKTQVFYLVENDHVSHRVLHVQLVAKIARTIGRFLNLNEDLIEAISLGHDVGHTPFGHFGERIISSFLKKHDAGVFEHNIQSFRLFHEVDNYGLGVNLSAQVLDGIICHNGELVEAEYRNDPYKTKEQLLEEYRESLKGNVLSKHMKPMTLEGCVMRVSDVIAYIGRDIEDAIVLKLIKREDIPESITSVLGNTNREIVNNLIIDIVNNSYGKNSISYSKKVYDALQELKDWNYRNIYLNPVKSTQDGKIENIFNCVLDECLKELRAGVDCHTGICNWIKSMRSNYRSETSEERAVADYVSGMTDNFLMNTYKNIVIPKSYGKSFA